MKKLFSVLMVAVVATLAFAFTPKASLLDVTYHLDGTEWVEGEGENCGGSFALCDISFDANFDQYAASIQSQVQSANSGAGLSAGQHTITTAGGDVLVTVTRKTTNP